MCNEKVLGPFEENESEESKDYRKKRAALLEATKQVENATKEALGIIAEFLVGNLKISAEAKNTAELITTLRYTKAVFTDCDELIITFNRGKMLGRVTTTFSNKNDNIEKVINEIKAVRGFINSKITKAGMLGNNLKIKLIMNKALKNLEEAVTDFSEL